MDPIKEALTFDDVTMAPKYSDVLPSEVDTSAKFRGGGGWRPSRGRTGQLRAESSARPTIPWRADSEKIGGFALPLLEVGPRKGIPFVDCRSKAAC